MRFKLMALAAAVSFTLPVAAQTAVSATPKPKKEKKVCRRLDQTGSILGGRPTCHTKGEWAQIDDANARNAGKALDAGRDVRNRGGDGSGF
jgi:hypothetical protein